MLVRGKETDAEWTALVSRHVDALVHMLNSEGWQLMRQFFEAEEKALKYRMATVKSGDDAMNIIGGLVVLSAVREYPVRAAEAYKRELKEGVARK